MRSHLSAVYILVVQLHPLLCIGFILLILKFQDHFHDQMNLLTSCFSLLPALLANSFFQESQSYFCCDVFICLLWLFLFQIERNHLENIIQFLIDFPEHNHLKFHLYHCNISSETLFEHRNSQVMGWLDLFCSHSCMRRKCLHSL